MSGCHNAASHKEGVILIDFQSVMQTGEIKPGNASDSELYEVITKSNSNDVMPPPPAAKLTSAQIQIIANWINQGAQNLTCDQPLACDSTNVSFSQFVLPLMQNSCAGCHSATNALGGIKLHDYTSVKSAASSGKLMGSINWANGYVAMPQSGGKLSNCNIAKIQSWINSGSLNN